jgi:eukaryotic-like serine/threonine-protein kinase
LLGTTLGERYVIEALIGEGGLGRVYRARHAKLSRRYAIKVPFGDVASDERLRHRFAQEAEAASRLGHANLVGVLDVGETDHGLLYLVMDLIEGDSLGRVIKRGPAAPELVALLIEQIAAGLAHAHDRALIHRDLKPDNVLVVATDRGPVARIVDFGIAIFRDDDHSRVTTQGIVMGTPHYMAPEQATGDKLDARTDLFALGVITYELLAGVLPFDGAAIDIARQHLAVTPPTIAERVPGLAVDPLLEALAFALMAKRAAARPQTAAEVVELVRLIGRDRAAAQARLAAYSTPAPAIAPASALPVATVDPRSAPIVAVALASEGVARSTFESLPTLRDGMPARRARPSRRLVIALSTAIALGCGAIVLVVTRSSPSSPSTTPPPSIAARPERAPGDEAQPLSMAPAPSTGANSSPPALVEPTPLAPPSAPPLPGSGTAPERVEPDRVEPDRVEPDRIEPVRTPVRPPERPPTTPTAGAGSGPAAGARVTAGAGSGATTTSTTSPGSGSSAGSAAAPPDPPPAVDAAALKRHYAAVGERLGRAFAEQDPRAPALRARYSALPFLQALRDPTEAARVERELRALDRDLARAP